MRILMSFQRPNMKPNTRLIPTKSRRSDRSPAIFFGRSKAVKKSMIRDIGDHSGFKRNLSNGNAFQKRQAPPVYTGGSHPVKNPPF
jgi:hypothetical protein